MTIYFCDIEADGLLEDVTKVHCLSVKPLNNDVMTMEGANDWIFAHAATDSTFVFHNSFGYDYAVLQKLGVIKDYSLETITLMDGTVRQVQNIDSLALSREWWPDNPRGHGLEAWAKYLGTYKPEISDWENLPIEEYVRRCEEDCRTTEKVFLFLAERLGISLT
jgi:hypothetical protein